MKRPFLIGIGGAHSRVGKTTLAVTILKYLSNTASHSHCQKWNKWGAIKYTKTAFYASIIDDHTILRQENKDTRRLIDAGAEEVLWVQSPVNELYEVLPIAVNRLSHLDGIIIEGNSAIEFLKPDIVVFIADVSKKKLKPSAHKIQKQADIIISNKFLVTSNKLKDDNLKLKTQKLNND
jgi:molybdopterin-guanine dinucleotide biosynthesis protein